MSPSVALLFLFPTFLVLIAAAWGLWTSDERRMRRKGLNVPPGSMGWPIIGETLAYVKRHPCNSLGVYMEERIHKYGKVSKSHLLGAPTIVSADPELNEFVLRNDRKLFDPFLTKNIMELFGETSLMATTVETHRYHKSLILDFLGISKLRGQYFSEANSRVTQALSNWEENTAFSLKNEASKVTFDVMAKTILSINPEDPRSVQLRSMYNSFSKGLVTILPLNIPGTVYGKAMKSRKDILKVIKELIEERLHNKREGTDSIGEADFLGYMLENSDVNAEQFRDLVLALLLAGHKTTSSAISFAAYSLQDCPKAMEQLREEHLNIIRAKTQSGEPTTLTWEDYRNMKFTHSVICETLRLANIANIAWRKATTDVHFKGYDIPSGWRVVLMLASAHVDPSLHQDPQKFDPWRWQAGTTSTTRVDNYIPYGRGMYKCVGGEVVNMMVAVFLHHLILNYSWEPVEPDHPVSFFSTEFPKGLPIKLRKLNFSKKTK